MKSNLPHESFLPELPSVVNSDGGAISIFLLITSLFSTKPSASISMFKDFAPSHNSTKLGMFYKLWL